MGILEVIKRIDKVLEAILFAYDAVPLMVTATIVLVFGVVRGLGEFFHWMKDKVWERLCRGKEFRVQTTILRADATIPTHPQSVIHHYQSGRSRKSGFRSLHRYQRS
jgi:hypothetical protein